MKRDGVDEIRHGPTPMRRAAQRPQLLAKNNFLICRFADPVSVVAGEDQIAAALETDKLSTKRTVTTRSGTN